MSYIVLTDRRTDKQTDRQMDGQNERTNDRQGSNDRMTPPWRNNNQLSKITLHYKLWTVKNLISYR